jgi:hypothetical protein
LSRRPAIFAIAQLLTDQDDFGGRVQGHVGEVWIMDRLSVRSDDPETLRRLGLACLETADALSRLR